MKVNGAVVLVTGGASGLGLAICQHLAELGAIVVAADCNSDALGRLPDGLRRAHVNVTNEESSKALAASVVDAHGRIDVLINCAGTILSEPFVNLLNPDGIMHGYARFRDNVTTNLDSVFIMTSAAVEQMIRRRTKGCVVNISSISAVGNEGQTAYSAAKAGVNAMTVTWAKELGRWGIRCNAIAPGFIDTESTRNALSESTLEHVRSSTPLRRLGQPPEIAHAVQSVIENEFITGTIMNINGGLSI